MVGWALWETGRRDLLGKCKTGRNAKAADPPTLRSAPDLTGFLLCVLSHSG